MPADAGITMHESRLLRAAHSRNRHDIHNPACRPTCSYRGCAKYPCLLTCKHDTVLATWLTFMANPSIIIAYLFLKVIKICCKIIKLFHFSINVVVAERNLSDIDNESCRMHSNLSAKVISLPWQSIHHSAAPIPTLPPGNGSAAFYIPL